MDSKVLTIIQPLHSQVDVGKPRIYRGKPTSRLKKDAPVLKLIAIERSFRPHNSYQPNHWLPRRSVIDGSHLLVDCKLQPFSSYSSGSLTCCQSPTVSPGLAVIVLHKGEPSLTGCWSLCISPTHTVVILQWGDNDLLAVNHHLSVLASQLLFFTKENHHLHPVTICQPGLTVIVLHRGKPSLTNCWLLFISPGHSAIILHREGTITYILSITISQP